MTGRKLTKTGLACYSKDQWPMFLSTVDDRDEWEETWEEWRANADRAIREMRSMRIEVVEVLLDIDELAEYCKKHNLPNDAKTRAGYVAEKMRIADLKDHGKVDRGDDGDGS